MDHFATSALHRVISLVVVPVSLFWLIFLAPATYVVSTVLRWVLGLTRLLKGKSPVWNPQGKVVLVSGASSGIGEYIAYEYAKKGAKLMLVGRNQQSLQGVGQRCGELGAPEVSYYRGDLRTEPACRGMVAETLRRYSAIDVLVVNAGIAPAFFFGSLQHPQGMKSIMDTNFWGCAWPTMYALPHLIKSGGQIVVTSSIASFMPLPRHTIYSCTKTALLQFFDTLRAEPAAYNLGVTVVMPGPTRSGLTKGRVGFNDATGNVDFDDKARDELFGPTPTVNDDHEALGPIPAAATETVAVRAVEGAMRRQHYVIVPLWGVANLFLRMFTPTLLIWTMRMQFVPLLNGSTEQGKVLQDALVGPGAPKVDMAVAAVASKVQQLAVPTPSVQNAYQKK